MTDDANLTARDLLTTTRSFRRRLDLTRTVSRQDVLDSLDVAVQAPTGSNRQAWHFVAVDDPDTRAKIAELYRKAFAANMSGRTPRPDQLADLSSAGYLAEHLHEVPVLVIACASGRLPQTAPPAQLASFYGSINPAIWNFMLALRLRGLGSCFTTAHLFFESEVAAILGIPYADVTQVAMIPVAHLRPGITRAASRRPAADVTTWNGWSNG